MVSHNKEIYRKDDTRMYVRSSKELRAKIKLLAIKKDTTMSEIVTTALNEYLEKEGENNDKKWGEN